jgi:hypothetical protein
MPKCNTPELNFVFYNNDVKNSGNLYMTRWIVYFGFHSAVGMSSFKMSLPSEIEGDPILVLQNTRGG